MKKWINGLFCTLLVMTTGAAQALTPAELEQALYKLADSAEGKNGFMEFRVGEIQYFMLMDPAANRMRIITPVAEYKDLESDQITAIMESNFHDALDARYALSNGVVYAAFIHPLSELSLAELVSAVYQVGSLSITFGREYSSGIAHFGGQGQPESE